MGITSRASGVLAVALALALPAILAGCVGRGDAGGDWTADAPDAAASAAPGTDKGWRTGKWWAYHATFDNNVSIDVALVVFDAEPDHFTLGTNLSAGFFGLPFHGNVTRPDLNPVVAREEWPLYRFPLEDGKSWDYEFFDYTLTTRVAAVEVDAPDVGSHAGFRMTSTAFGRTVVEYTYSPEVEWFTELVIYEPTDGHEVVRVELTDYGPSYEDDYFVNVPVHAVDVQYPAAPASDRFTVTGNYLSLTASVVLHARAGAFQFEIEDPRGRSVMSGASAPTGLHMDRKTLGAEEGSWRVEDVGVGAGRFVLEVTGLKGARDGVVQPVTPDAARPRDAGAPTVDFLGLLARAGGAPAERGVADVPVVEGVRVG